MSTVFSQSLSVTDICPLSIIIEKGDNECRSPSQLGPGEILTGKTLKLTTVSRIERVNFGSFLNAREAFQCHCDYALFPEDRELTDCSDESSEEATVPNYFNTVFLYRWIEPPLNEQENCEAFRNEFGYTPEPFFSVAKFDFFTGNLGGYQQVVPGIANTEKAVMMMSPYSDSRWFSHDYLRDNYTYPIDLIANVAVSYETCEPEQPAGVFLVDLNPEYYENGISDLFDPIESIEDVLNVATPESLEGRLTKFINGTTADGASKIMVVISSEGFDRISLQNPDNDNGMLEFPWGRQTFTFSGGEYFIGIYTPPDHLPQGNELINQEGLAYQVLSFSAEISKAGDEKEVFINIPVIRPPVILVHGTFDNPDNCWKTPIQGEESMYQRLVDERYKVYTLDYSETNGSQSGPCPESWLFSSDALISSFYCNRSVLYDNPGGIKEAIAYYRDELGVAATRVDVIGHSMGGIIPRVYASDSEVLNGYNTGGYYRTDNLEEGDINRIITIASTHKGSDFSEFQTHLNEAWRDSDLPILERLADFTTSNLLWFGAGVGETGAVLDQQPYSNGLRRIGPTPIPSHAIVCTVRDIKAMEDNKGEPGSFGTYANLFKGTAAYFYFFPGVVKKYIYNLLNKYKRAPSDLRTRATNNNGLFTNMKPDSVLLAAKPTNREEFSDMIIEKLGMFWQDWHILQESADEDEDWVVDRDRFELDYSTAEYNHYEADDQFDDLVRSRDYDFIIGETPYNNVLRESNLSSADFLRYLIFKNDLNDGVVRRESQIGGLSEQYISEFDDHIHSYAPRYPEVIDRVVELLGEDEEAFAPQGFPTTDQPSTLAIPNIEELSINDDTTSIERFGCEAKCWSGMVLSHADAFLEVAVDNNVVIIGRPVNPDATPLIQMDAATKGMNLKGKSSNWGPQKGYIPVNQRYSKLWNLYGGDVIRRDTQIVVFSGKTSKQLKSSPDEVVQRQLSKSYECKGVQEEYEVYYDTLITDAEQSIFLVQSTDESYVIKNWRISDNGTCPSAEATTVENIDHLIPMSVMSKPRTDDTLFYTADYDLLAIGFYESELDGYRDDEYDIPTLTNFDKQKGLITPRQEGLLDKLNEEVELTGYNGGDVSHHGPENQFYVLDNPPDGSPYIDYPVIAFYPENGEGIIHAIPKGPENFRDIYLKRFMAEKRREGYNLYENLHSPGWSWSHYRRYSFNQGWDDRDDPNLPDSPEEIPFPDDCTCENDQDKKIESTTQRPTTLVLTEEQSNNQDYSIYPNPANSFVNISISSKSQKSIDYTILSSDARLAAEGELKLQKGKNIVQIDITSLSVGNYYLILSDDQKIMSKMIHINK